MPPAPLPSPTPPSRMRASRARSASLRSESRRLDRSSSFACGGSSWRGRWSAWSPWRILRGGFWPGSNACFAVVPRRRAAEYRTSLERALALPLPRRARVALLVNDALGNLCVGTIVAQGLRHLAPDVEVVWFGGPRTAALEARDRHDAATVDPTALGSFDAVVNLERDGRWPVLAGLLDAPVRVGPLVIAGAVVPFAGDPTGRVWADPDWARRDLRARHPILETSFIGEILYKACGLPKIADGWPGGIPRYALPTNAPPRDTPAVLLSTGGSRADKIWPLEKWLEVIDALDEPVGLLGADPKRQ